VGRTAGAPRLRKAELAARGRLQRLARRGLQQALAVELELLDLELALLRESFALSAQMRVAHAGRQRSGLAPRELVALHLLLLELLQLQTLLELELVETSRIGRREVVTPRAHTLLQIQIERVLLLPQLQLAARAVGVRVECNGRTTYEYGVPHDEGE
jgi:hypothetical protein